MFKRVHAALAVVAVLAATFAVGSGANAAELELSPPGDSKMVEESSTGSYIVVMEADPVVAEIGPEALDTAAAEVLITELEDSHEDVLEDAGIAADDKVQDFTIALNGFSATLSHEEAIALAAQSKVLLVLPDELRQVTTDSSTEFLGLTGPKGAHGTGTTGEGVVVGVIDTGIWPEHPSFADNGLAAPPVVLEDTAENPACDFGNVAHNPDDAPFVCNNKLIGARQMLGTYRALVGAEDHEFDSARDDNGHGTHTASTAAGNANVTAAIFGEELGEISGIAPDAHVIMYKALGEGGGFTSDLVSAIDQAVLDGVDVINYSIGGGANLGSGDAIAFLFAADAGVLVATSAGNAGPGSETIGGPADLPWVTTVGASTQTRFFEGLVRLGNGRRFKGASITLGLDGDGPSGKVPLTDAADAGGDLCLPDTLDPDVVAGTIVLCRRGAIARVAKGLSVFAAGGIGMILYNNDDEGDLLTDTHWVPSVHTDLTEGLAIKDYIATTARPEARLITGRVARWRSAPSMASFSSRGANPSSSDLIKPDLTAPGVQILAGASPFVDPGSVPGELFQSIQGTSMSSPHVAGVFALISQEQPEWSPAMAKSAVMTTSDQDVKDNDRRSRATPFEMGSGHLDPGRVTKKNSVFRPGLVYDAGLFEYAAFTCGADVGIFTAGTCDFLAGLGLPFDGSDLNLPSIGVGELAGTQTVTRTVTSVADRTITFRARTNAPDGYNVTVTPKRITLAPGESATFDVEIANDGTGVVGEWSFGWLKWIGSGYSVFSPIAVRGAQIDAPGLVTGTGVDGSAGFDVAFGYDGAYEAVGLGLEAATVTTDTVVQDPDQAFDPTDGFSNAHTFDLTDAAFFRMSLPPGSTEAEADLDVYLFDPSGVLAAASTAGGTDELIDIAEPEPGVWTVYIQGWQTIGPDSTYDMNTWIIPAASGGSLSVDSAPGSAIIGQVGSVDVSWTGLDPDQSYLGAVAHRDAEGVVAVTLVEVSTATEPA